MCYYDKEASAATWLVVKDTQALKQVMRQRIRSVIGRQLHSSAWPSILFSDSSTTTKVDLRVTIAANTSIIFVILVTVASIVTPLGLQDKIKRTGSQNFEFTYVTDDSLFGRSTQRRPDLPLSRICSHLAQLPCPGVDFDGVLASILNDGNPSFEDSPNFISSTTLPKNTTDFFSSASRHSTVAGPLDVQYRSWTLKNTSISGDNSSYIAGLQRTVDIIIPRESVTLVEGLIVDLTNGGVGFRNHTIPDQSSSSKSWEEDILWIEPKIGCASTNLSLEFTIGLEGFLSTVTEMFLVDEGGFAELRPDDSFRLKHMPNLNTSNPDVGSRAMHSVLSHNLYLSIAYNLTRVNRTEDVYTFEMLDTGLGDRYRLQRSGYGFGSTVVPLGLNTVSLRNISGRFDLPVAWFNESENISVYGEEFPPEKHEYPPERYEYLRTIAMLNDVDDWCSGRWQNDVVSSNKILANAYNVKCGYFFGAPSRIDGGSSLEEEVGSKWKTSLSICAGAAKASIRAVSFQSNGSFLKDVYVTKMKDKAFVDGTHPLWAVEDYNHAPNEAAVNAPLWGVVDNTVAETVGFNFSRLPEFYLPFPEVFRNKLFQDSLAATIIPTAVLISLVSGDLQYKDTIFYMETYRGTNNLALRSRWENLSSSADHSAELILKLIWTDVMANTVVGTRSRLPTTSPDGIIYDAIPGEVGVYGRRIAYDVRFAIPAVLLLTLWIIVILCAAWISIIHKSTLGRLKRLINDTSLGRAVLRVDLPGGRDAAKMLTSDWVKNVGHIKLALRESKSQLSSEFGAVEQNSDNGRSGQAYGRSEGHTDTKQLAVNECLLTADRS